MSPALRTIESEEQTTIHWGIKFLIYPRFQLLLILVNTLITLSIFGVVYLQIYRAFERFKLIGNQIHLPAGHAFYELIDVQAQRIYIAMAIATVIGILLSSIFMLVLSYRLARPIVRISKYFSSLSKNGSFKNLEAKKGEFFNHLPEEINGALQTLVRNRSK
ncbi:MAG: hypothetical protein ABIQ95_01140 [Bdellovibrionia bacterium]